MQKWGTTTYPEAVVGDVASAGLARMIEGINTIGSLYYGTADPDDGTWGADELGRIWLDSTNEIDAAGDDLGPVWKVWAMLTVTPTYGWRAMNIRGRVDVSPIVEKVGVVNQSDTAYTDCDVTAQTSARATHVLIGVEVEDSGTPASTVYAAFRKNGVTTDDQTQRIYPQVADIPIYQTFWVPLDSGQIFEYTIEASGANTFDLKIDILAYEERP